LIVDGHEDLAFNALADGRDYLTSAEEIRAAEAGTEIEEASGRAMLGLRDWLEAGVGVILATLTTLPRSHAGHGELSYATVEAAHVQVLAQLEIYRRWDASAAPVELIYTRGDLDRVCAAWKRAGDGSRVGLVLLMENADSIRTPDEVGFWVEQGVRVIGPAWHSNRYSGGSLEGGPLTADGRQLLVEMARHGVVLDVTHMSDEAAVEALRFFDGPIVASHAHSRRTKPIARLLADGVVEEITARDGVVGVLPLNWALAPGWRRGDPKDAVSIAAVVDAIDDLRELTGDVRHIGIGTDFDGGQGAESVPVELDTIADLPKLSTALAARAYSEEEVAAVMGGSWLRFLRAHLP
jgi:membrane dipeptidase